ncbi:hypothetical protein YC2023_058722 [Brassica napus]
MILVVVIELRFYSSNSQNLTCHPRELEALRDFINELDSKPDEIESSLTDKFNFCQNSTEVRLIRLESNSFSGDIPYGFEKCAELTGNIPEDLFQLQRLNLLEIQEKGLSGSLGPALDSAEGSLAKSLANSQSLILLNLGNNSLSGPLYLNCAVMTNLASLDLGTNKFNSSFPEYLPSCRHLHYVNLGRYHFYGQAPESFKDFIDASHPSALQEPDNSDSHFEFPWRDVA